MEGVEFAKKWLEADFREAFPELPKEFIQEVSEKLAPATARELKTLLYLPYPVGRGTLAR